MKKENDTILSIKNLHVYFKTHGKDSHVIRGINLDIQREECFAIVGESGSGKSVFTKTFTGMLDINGKIKQGSIILNGVDVDDPRIIHRRFGDIHRHDIKMEKSRKRSADVAKSIALDKENSSFDKKISKLDKQIALTTNEGYIKYALEKLEAKHLKKMNYYNLYFMDHINKAYNNVSNCMIKQSSIFSSISGRISRVLSRNKSFTDVEKLEKTWEETINSNQKVLAIIEYIKSLKEEVSKHADFTTGQTVVYKALYRNQVKYKRMMTKLYLNVLSELVKNADSSKEVDIGEHLSFVQEATDIALEFAYAPIETKKEIYSIRMKKIRMDKNLKFDELEEQHKKSIETIRAVDIENGEKEISKRSKLEAQRTKLVEAHQNCLDAIETKYKALMESYESMNAEVLKNSTLSESEKETYKYYQPAFVKKYVLKMKQVEENRKLQKELDEKIHVSIEEAIKELDNGNTLESLNIASKVGFAPAYYTKRIKNINKEYESHKSTIDASLLALEKTTEKEKLETQKHLLEVEKEAAHSTMEADLNQVSRDVKNALSIYSSSNNAQMSKLLDKEHCILNEVSIFRRAYRIVRTHLTIHKPLVKSLRDKGIIRNKSVNLAKFSNNRQWSMIRGSHIATIFQDPMTSLNPLIKIGSQITDVLRLHHNLTKAEAKAEAISLLDRVHIPNPEERFNDYPYQYSGGMRQRVVIAIALACRPDILICDEPTTALDVTVQAQILSLIKDLQKEYKFTTIFITHDLGVVAGVADRVGVMYGGQLVEIGTDEDIFYNPAHPYTWALLSSLPQLAVENEPLTFIRGNPPVFTKEIEGDSFAPRSDYAMRIDYMIEPPMFKISETHYAKTWLLDPRAPKVKKPAVIRNLSKRMEETAKSFLSSSVENGGN